MKQKVYEGGGEDEVGWHPQEGQEHAGQDAQEQTLCSERCAEGHSSWKKGVLFSFVVFDYLLNQKKKV